MKTVRKWVDVKAVQSVMHLVELLDLLMVEKKVDLMVYKTADLMVYK